MRVKRSQVFGLRNAIGDVYSLLERSDHSQIAEYQRDLVAQSCVALWELDLRRLFSCLRRLCDTRVEWVAVHEKARLVFMLDSGL